MDDAVVFYQGHGGIGEIYSVLLNNAGIVQFGLLHPRYTGWRTDWKRILFCGSDLLVFYARRRPRRGLLGRDVRTAQPAQVLFGLAPDVADDPAGGAVRGGAGGGQRLPAVLRHARGRGADLAGELGR
jgi:hypothetical protein